MFFGIGLFEVLAIAAIIGLLAAPLLVAGTVIWIVLSRPPRRPKD